MKFLYSLIHWMGLIYLSAFVLNIGILWFFTRNWVGCGFVEAQLIYVRCGDSAGARFLEYFFLYGSPLVAAVYKFNLNLLFNRWSEISELQAWAVSVLTAVMTFVFLSSLIVLRQMVHGFVVHRRDRSFLARSKRILAILMIPAIISFSYRLYLQPPQWVNRDITVDVWDGSFTVPRGFLKDWSLVEVPRPEHRPNEYSSRLATGKMKSVPFLNFYVPVDLKRKHDNNLTVMVNPHYEPMTEESMDETREDYILNRLALRTEETKTRVYAEMKQTLNAWEIHQPQNIDGDYYPDLYVWRGEDGKPDHVLECTAMNFCAVKAFFVWSPLPCGKAIPCNCTRMCKDMSLGTPNYNIRYEFDKKYIDRYLEIDAEIRKFVASFYTPEDQLGGE